MCLHLTSESTNPCLCGPASLLHTLWQTEIWRCSTGACHWFLFCFCFNSPSLLYVQNCCLSDTFGAAGAVTISVTPSLYSSGSSSSLQRLSFTNSCTDSDSSLNSTKKINIICIIDGWVGFISHTSSRLPWTVTYTVLHLLQPLHARTEPCCWQLWQDRCHRCEHWRYLLVVLATSVHCWLLFVYYLNRWACRWSTSHRQLQRMNASGGHTTPHHKRAIKHWRRTWKICRHESWNLVRNVQVQESTVVELQKLLQTWYILVGKLSAKTVN